MILKDKWALLDKSTRGAIIFFLVLGVIGVIAVAINPKLLEVKQPRTVKAAPNVITLSKYNRLSDGASYADAVRILGQEGVEISSNNLAGVKTIMYQWKGPGIANMNATFQNDKLVSKAQFGLE